MLWCACELADFQPEDFELADFELEDFEVEDAEHKAFERVLWWSQIPNATGAKILAPKFWRQKFRRQNFSAYHRLPGNTDEMTSATVKV